MKEPIRKNKRWIRISIFTIVIAVLILGISLSSNIDDDIESFWVHNHNVWLTDFLGVLLTLTIGYIIVSWIFSEWRKIQTLKNEKVKAELALLKNQINPHFFFNTLNNLFSLIKKDADMAQTYVLKLSDLMRFTIYNGNEETVSIEEEINYLKNFIDLQVARYHKDIDIRFDVAITDHHHPIPPLLFIILLENAFKHGVEKIVTDPFVHISIRENKEQVTFKIENNYDTEVSKIAGGIGLENLKARLERLYPDDQHQMVFTEVDGVHSVKLELYLL